MPNTLTGLFQTLVLPAVAQLQRPTMYANAMIRKVYVQPQPQPGSVGQTINVNIPKVSENDVVDIGNGPIQITDQDQDSVSLVVNNNKSKAFRIPDFDRVRTPVDLKSLYLAPAVESVTRKINRGVCNLVNTTNFNVHTSITGGADLFTRANLGLAKANLLGVGVPDEPENLNFVTSHIPYMNTVTATEFWQQYQVGERAAEAARNGVFFPLFGANFAYDQQFPVPTTGCYAGLLFHRHAIAIVPVVPPTENKPNVEETFYSPEGSGLTYRIQFWYDPREQGWILHVHCMFALAVVRPNFGSYLVST